MVFLNWFIWIISCLALLMFLKDIFDNRTIVRIATRLISICLIFALVITFIADISKLHLLWFVPIIFFVSRIVAARIVMKKVIKRKKLI